MRKTLIFFILFVCLSLVVSGNSLTLTQFDDSSTAFNTTSNISKSITLPLNATIVGANVTFKGYNTSVYLYQENPNSTYCDSGWEGSFPSTNTYDGDYGTFGVYASTVGSCEQNYTKESNYISGLWQVKDAVAGLRNITIPTSCWSYDANVLMVKYESSNEPVDASKWYCYNGTWETLSISNTSADGIIFEEAMNWEVDQIYPKDVVCSLNGTTFFSNDGNLTGTNTSVDFASGLETCNNQQVACTFTCGASVYGQLEISDLDIEYTRKIILNVYDEETDQLITQNITATLISNSYARNFTFDTGTINITDIPNEEIEIRYGGSDYRERAYFVTIDSFQTSLDLYTVKNTTSSLILFQIVDEKGIAIFNGTLKTKRYFISDNSYLLVGMERINQNGESGMYLVPNDVPYEFLVEKNGVVLGTFTAQKIFSSTVRLKVTRLDDILQSFQMVRDSLSTSLQWNNDTNIISFVFNDASGLVQQACLDLKKTTSLQSVALETQCASSSSGTITINATQYLANATFTATGRVLTGTTYSEPVTNILVRDFGLNFNKFGNDGLFWAYMFIGTMFFLGVFFSFSIAVVYLTLSLGAMQVFGLAYFTWPLIVTIGVVGFVIAVVNKI